MSKTTQATSNYLYFVVLASSLVCLIFFGPLKHFTSDRSKQASHAESGTYQLSHSQQPYRTIKVKNSCHEPISFSITTGSAPYSSGKYHCQNDGDCISGSACNTVNGICFWNQPKLSNGFRLLPNQESDMHFPIISNGHGIVGSGNIGACRDGTCKCDGNGCRVGDASPINMAEWTLSKQGSDYYDVTLINGFNVGMEMKPLNAPSGTGNNPFHCGNPGGRKGRNGNADCSYNFQPPSMEYYWVSAGGKSCSDSRQCPNGQICGLSNNPGHQERLKRTCGNHLGYWTADQICGIDQHFGAPFYCESPLPYPNAGATNWNLYACNGPVASSCYQRNPSSSCCGCINWDEMGINVPISSERCQNRNTNWLSISLPKIEWLKRAVPTAYTYPYDDMSSTFICSNMVNGNNMAEYQITFCPQ